MTEESVIPPFAPIPAFADNEEMEKRNKDLKAKTDNWKERLESYLKAEEVRILILLSQISPRHKIRRIKALREFTGDLKLAKEIVDKIFAAETGVDSFAKNRVYIGLDGDGYLGTEQFNEPHQVLIDLQTEAAKARDALTFCQRDLTRAQGEAERYKNSYDALVARVEKAEAEQEKRESEQAEDDNNRLFAMRIKNQMIRTGLNEIQEAYKINNSLLDPLRHLLGGGDLET